MWDTERDWQRVALEGISLEVRVGVFSSEQEEPQRVVVSVELFRHGGAYTGGGLDACLDYDRLYRHLVETWPGRPQTGLVEELIEELLAFCFADPRVEACRVAVAKPDIYGGRAIPTVEVYRRRPGG
ncbi:MAG TPA: dihydroneopterin aldolase [Geminicoccaceae bacterium]|nr:dihydroneopterin aldolase [Geminicoccaceae bacterium]